jgi:hypothetical protein
MTRVLICGGRMYGNVPPDQTDDPEAIAKAMRERALLKARLDHYNERRGFSVLIHGGAMGADYHAKWWAIRQRLPVVEIKADWTLGKKAGPLRNQRLIEEGRPDLAIAFPGGKGTADMVTRLRIAGIETIKIEAHRYEGLV